MSAALSRHVPMTREEFLRVLPDAIDGRPHRVDDDMIEVDATDNGRVLIRVTEKPRDTSGDRDAPSLQVDFTFESMSDDEARLFMQAFDAHDL